MYNNKKQFRIIGMATICLIFILWFWVSNFTNVSPLFLPTPQKVWETFITICRDGYKNSSLLTHIGSSLYRLLFAYILAVATAIPLGLLSGYFSKIHAMLEPIINFYRPLPPLAYYTLLILWMGIDDVSKIFLLYLASFAPIYIACSSSVAKIEPNYVYNAITLGASKIQVFRTVIFPLTLPDVFAGMRTSLSAGYTTLVSAEMIAARNGIGWMVLDASNYLRSDIIFIGIIIMGFTGILLDKIILTVEKICVPWKGKNT